MIINKTGDISPLVYHTPKGQSFGPDMIYKI